VTPPVKLWPVQEAELDVLLPLYWDPAAPGAYQWFGFRMQKVADLLRRWREDGLINDESSYLTVLVDDVTAGAVTWRSVGLASTFEIGAAVFAAHRGHGVGTEAQRQLVEYLFSTTPVHRLQAGTEPDNIAEQRALERVGFRREGVRRGVHFRNGQWRDSVDYGLLREDPR
jgi:RimJ/RimL family protein N-acetyltransferase